jgi:hypothetical protein
MPRTEIEITGENTKTITERINVVVDVPQDVLDGDLQQWAEQQMQDSDSELSKEANDPVNISQEDETEGYDITSVTYIGPHD